MKHLFSILLFSFVLLAESCDPHDGKLVLVNNSNEIIYYDVLNGDSIKSFPIVETAGKVDSLFSNIIEPHNKQSIPVMDTWEYFINKKCKDSTLRIFFFTNDLIKNAGKDSIMKHQLYSKREKLKVKDLEKLNWRVVYP